MKTIKVWLKIINCCSKGNVVSLRNSMKFPEANKYMDTKKPRDSSSLPKNSHWFEILSCLRLKKGLFTPTLYFLELSSHQTVDFPEQGEPQKSLSLWVHAHSFFFRGTEDGPEKLSLEWVLFSLKANLVIKVRNRTISKRCCLIYFSLSLKARQATYSPYGCRVGHDWSNFARTHTLKARWPLSVLQREARALLASCSLEPLETGLSGTASCQEPLLSPALSAHRDRLKKLGSWQYARAEPEQNQAWARTLLFQEAPEAEHPTTQTPRESIYLRSEHHRTAENTRHAHRDFKTFLKKPHAYWGHKQVSGNCYHK